MEVKTSSKEETQKIGADFAKSLKIGDVVALYGSLGSGKTTFVQGLAKGLGIKRRILSPTFVFLRSYPVKFKGKNIQFNHLDLYRANFEVDAESLGLEEILVKSSLSVVEWAEKIEKFVPKKRINIFFEIKDENTRIIGINNK